MKEYDSCILIKSIPEEPNVRVGSRGAVLIVYNDSPVSYEVEFFDENKCSIAVCTVREDFVRPVRT